MALEREYILNSIKNIVRSLASITWPYISIQAFLRIFLFLTKIKYFLSYQLLLVPFALLGGILKDIILITHISLIALFFASLIPIELRSSIIGKLIERILIEMFGLFSVYIFWLELFVWIKFDTRFASDFTFYSREIIVFLENISRSYSWYSVAFLLVILIIMPSLAISNVIRRVNIAFREKIKMESISIDSIKIVLLGIAGILMLDFYNSKFDLVGSIYGYKINPIENRYLSDVSKNGLYEIVTDKFSRLWSFEDRYISFSNPQSAIKKSIVRNLLSSQDSFFVDEGSDLSSNSAALRVVKPINFTNRKNLIVIQLDNISYDNSSHIGGVSHFKSMPYLSELALDEIYFSNAYAISNRRNEFLFASMFSILPVHVKDSIKDKEKLLSFSSILKGQGYKVAAFAKNSIDRRESNYLLSQAGFDILYSDSLLREIGIGNLNDNTESNPAKFISIKNGVRYKDSIDFLSRSVSIKASNVFKKGDNFFYYISSDLFSAGKVKFSRSVVDSNLMYLVKKLKEEEWFKDTIIVILSSSGGADKGTAPINPESYRIPMVVLNYSPSSQDTIDYSEKGDVYLGSGLDKDNARISSVVSCPTGHLDLAPTLMHMLGIGYISNFYGSNALRCPKNKHLLFKRDSAFAYVVDDYMLIMSSYKNFDFYLSKDNFQTSRVISNIISRKGKLWKLEDSFSSLAKRKHLLSFLNGREDGSFAAGLCQNCSYTVTSLNLDGLGWSCGHSYSKPLNREIFLMKQEEAKKRFKELIFMNGVAFIQSNALESKNVTPIKYNIINSSDFD